MFGLENILINQAMARAASEARATTGMRRDPGPTMRRTEREFVPKIASAKSRAQRLLRRTLPKKEWYRYTTKGFVFVRGSAGGLYKLTSGRAYNVLQLQPKKRKLCAVPQDASSLEIADIIVAQYLALVNDEKGFVKKANVGVLSELARGPLWNASIDSAASAMAGEMAAQIDGDILRSLEDQAGSVTPMSRLEQRQHVINGRLRAHVDEIAQRQDARSPVLEPGPMRLSAQQVDATVRRQENRNRLDTYLGHETIGCYFEILLPRFGNQTTRLILDNINLIQGTRNTVVTGVEVETSEETSIILVFAYFGDRTGRECVYSTVEHQWGR